MLFGGLLVIARPSLMWVHILAVAWGGLTMIFDFGCPMTPWEKKLLRRGGRVPYEEGFVQHHLLRNRGNPSSTKRNHVLLGVGALLFNLLVYVFILRSPP